MTATPPRISPESFDMSTSAGQDAYTYAKLQAMSYYTKYSMHVTTSGSRGRKQTYDIILADLAEITSVVVQRRDELTKYLASCEQFQQTIKEAQSQ